MLIANEAGAGPPLEVRYVQPVGREKRTAREGVSGPFVEGASSEGSASPLRQQAAGRAPCRFQTIRFLHEILATNSALRGEGALRRMSNETLWLCHGSYSSISSDPIFAPGLSRVQELGRSGLAAVCAGDEPRRHVALIAAREDERSS
jgi:hypothetical protein